MSSQALPSSHDPPQQYVHTIISYHPPLPPPKSRLHTRRPPTRLRRILRDDIPDTQRVLLPALSIAHPLRPALLPALARTRARRTRAPAHSQRCELYPRQPLPARRPRCRRRRRRTCIPTILRRIRRGRRRGRIVPPAAPRAPLADWALRAARRRRRRVRAVPLRRVVVRGRAQLVVRVPGMRGRPWGMSRVRA